MEAKLIDSTGANVRLTPNPETARFGTGAVMNYSQANAIAFAVVQGSVALAQSNTHLAIFNALRVVADPAGASPFEHGLFESAGTSGVYADFGITFYPDPPDEKGHAWFSQIPRTLHAMRQATVAGRAWINVEAPGRRVSVVSWWVRRRDIRPATVTLVACALGLSGKVLIEFADSVSPETHTF